MSTARLTELFKRHLDNACMPREKRELAELALLAENQTALQALIGDAWDENAFSEEMPGGLGEEILEKILNPGPLKTARRRTLWVRRIAVAAVLTGVTMGIYTVFLKTSEKQPAAAANAWRSDVAPGGNKAILTLSNGNRIILDSAHLGTLARQGNTNIIKTDSGKLTYNLSEKPNSNNPNLSEIVYNTLSTPRGGQYQLTLPDGTKVWLNAVSSITYPTAFAGNERKVTITGEAYFEVAHDASKPFSVSVSGIEVQDVGTHFDINAYTDEPAIKTTLIEGAVKINRESSSILLQPGQQAMLVANDRIKILNNVNIENVIAWKEGKFHFASEDIGTIMRQVARWYNVEIVYRGKFQETFTGGIPRQENISELLRLLEYSATTLKFEIEGERIIVEPK